MLNDQPYQSLGVENEFITWGVLVSYKRVESTDLWRGRQKMEGIGSCYAKVCSGQFFSQLETPLGKVHRSKCTTEYTIHTAKMSQI